MILTAATVPTVLCALEDTWVGMSGTELLVEGSIAE